MIKFGPSGNSLSFTEAGLKSTEEAAFFVSSKGLNAYEYSFGRGVRMSLEKAASIGRAMRENGVEISVHAPYYINFANPDDEMASKSFGYLLDSARAVKAMGGKRCVFHAATVGKSERLIAIKLAQERLKMFCDRVYEEGLEDIIFCPETMGKLGQIGDEKEIAEFCKAGEIYMPCVDFGHLNARSMGSLKGREDYKRVIDNLIEILGYERIKYFHIHFSKIQYSQKGEIRHLTFEDEKYGPLFEPLAQVLKEYELEPVIISESAGTQAEDAAEMMRIYNKI